jgi:hypothetical protein
MNVVLSGKPVGAGDNRPEILNSLSRKLVGGEQWTD